MPDINFIKSEIERMRVQLSRQRKEIQQLERAGISTASAELLLGRMLVKVEGLRDERDRLKAEQPHTMQGKVLGGRKW
ncbi:hypothetical protein [Tardiphaga sp.]|jgi:hypothetical protein|uniref:hypothetical protein n=1 Tax=Tardiphaga sp. TaxID=1926292 RepID=UPI0037DA459C